jgi:hypothetical protein
VASSGISSMVVKDHEDPLAAVDPFPLRYEKLDLLPN